jgi:hypothetical protein
MITRMFIVTLITLLFSSVVVIGFDGNQQWTDMEILKSLVLIKEYEYEKHPAPWGTGFLLDLDTSSSDIFFITCRHIVINRDSLELRFFSYKIVDSMIIFNPLDLISLKWKERRHYIPASDDSDFVAIALPRRLKDSLNCGTISLRDIIRSNQLYTGDDVLYYGYQYYNEFFLDKTKWQLPIVRTGTIAFFLNEFVYDRGRPIYFPGMFLIDGVSSGGGSGSPIYVKRPSAIRGNETKYDKKLAGIITGHMGKPGDELAKAISITTIIEYILKQIELEK